jgi:hypothetical protein
MLRCMPCKIRSRERAGFCLSCHTPLPVQQLPDTFVMLMGPRLTLESDASKRAQIMLGLFIWKGVDLPYPGVYASYVTYDARKT